MNAATTRRHFLKTAAGTGALLGLGDLGFLSRLRPVSAAEAKLEPDIVRFNPDIEPLVRLLEDTPRERVLEEVGARLKRGLEHLSTIVMDLRYLTRTREPERQPTEMNALLDEVIELAGDRLERPPGRDLPRKAVRNAQGRALRPRAHPTARN